MRLWVLTPRKFQAQPTGNFQKSLFSNNWTDLGMYSFGTLYKTKSAALGQELIVPKQLPIFICENTGIHRNVQILVDFKHSNISWPNTALKSTYLKFLDNNISILELGLGTNSCLEMGYTFMIFPQIWKWKKIIIINKILF